MNTPGVDTRLENPDLAATTVYDWKTLFVEVVVWLNCLDGYDPDDYGAWLGDRNFLVKLDGEWSGDSSFLETEFHPQLHSMRFNYPHPIDWSDDELNLKVRMHDAYTSLTGQSRWTYYPDITGIDIFDHQSQQLSPLGVPDTGLPWEYDHLYFFNMMHAINYFNEHYNLHSAPYPVYLAFDDTYNDPGCNFAVFTFEIDTTRFAANAGEWYLTVTVDPYDDIEETNEFNNVYAVTAEPAFLIDTATEVAEELLGPEEVEAFAACDPDFYQSPLEEIQVVLDRARWADNFGWHWNHEWWEANSASGIDESDGFVPRRYDWAFNIGNEALDRAEKIHLTEFYGPYGWGKIKREAGDWELIYGNTDDCGGPGQLPCRPRPSEIKNVFLFSTGLANGSSNTIGVGTQNEPNDNYCTPSGLSGFDDESVASCIKSAHKFCGSRGEWIDGEHMDEDCSHNIKFGSMFTQIIENEDDYLEYGPENSLLTSIWTSNYKAGNLHKNVVRLMWFYYLASRTNNFSNVENFVCGGNSRGGMLCIVLAKMIQSYKNGVDHPDIPDAYEAAYPYTPDPPDKDLRVVVLGITPSNVHEGDGLTLGNVSGNNGISDAYYAIGNSGTQYYGNGTCYDYNYLFPADIRNDLYLYVMADNNLINRGFIHFHNCDDSYERPYYPCVLANYTSNWPHHTQYCRYDTDTIPDNNAGTYVHQYFTPPFTMPAGNQGPSFLWQSWRSITHSNMCGDWTKWYNLWNALDFMGWKFGWLTDPAVSFSENRPECSY
jgi:hypothetical protein